MAQRILFLLVSVVLTVVWSQGEKTTDICSTTKIVPQLDMRDSNNIIGPKQQPINDRFLTEGWYHTDGQILLSSAPGFKRCGALYPVWRNTSGVNVTMCIQTHVKPCHKTIEIETASCGGKKIYKLKRSSLHDAAYCFVWPDGQDPPDFPEKPEVIFGLVDDGTLEFKCAFKKHLDELLYRTYWHVNGRHIRTEGPSIWTDIGTHNLTEEKLRNSNIHTVGFVIQCSVRVSEEIKSPMSRPVFSDGEFIGIKVDETSITLKPTESTKVYLQLTAPFGCRGRSEEMCRLYIELHQPDDDKGLDVSTCGAIVPKSDWNSTVSIKVYGRTSRTIEDTMRVLKLKLRTSENVHHPFWANYDLDLITVQLITNTKILKKKACSAISDPHMKTFDGRQYEHQHEGVFTLYKHNHLPVEIQIKTARCVYFPGTWCTCGIAVRAGTTVYEMNKCHNKTFNRYTQCDSGGDVLQVQQRLEKKYEINLPTGGQLRVTEWKFYELTLFPSIADTGNCSGLCGILASGRKDDFFLRDGRYSKSDTFAFSESWRVNETKSLFNREILGNLSSWPRTHLLCHCDETDQRSIITEANCSATEAATWSDRLNTFKTTKCKQVTQPPQDTPGVSTYTVKDRRLRRQSDSAWQGGWTVEKASEFCVDSFRKSRSIQVCENVTSLEITESIEICVLDIQLTGTTDFAMSAIQNVREKCLHEVEVNPAYWKKENTTVVNQSIYDIVVEGACLNDCSGNGHCVQGFCVCESVYGGSDCSVDLTIPPTITYVENDGACDMTRDECFDISIYGNTFAEGQTKCLVEEIKVTDKKSEMVNSKSGTASFESIGHVICTIESSDDTDSDDVEYVRAFWISISNNNANYSTRVGVMVHYGSCVHPTVEGLYFKWSIEGPYCLYKGICVRHLEEQPGKECKVCDVYNNTRIWKDNTDSKCQSETHFPVAIVASCAALLVAITAVVVVMCVVRRRFTRNRNLANKTPVRFSPTKMK